MNVAFGLKAHSGWAALVVIGKHDGQLVVVDRSRIELVEEAWAKQPYHAAEDLKPHVAQDLVKRGISSANRIALRELRHAVRREQKRDNVVAACGVLVTDPMPGWTTDEILAVHFRMHKAEGVLFRNALSTATKTANLRLIEVNEKTLAERAERSLKVSTMKLSTTISTLGKSVGPPWGKDQKEATVAAMIALQTVGV